MSRRWRAEEVLEQLQRKEIDEWDAKRELRKIYDDECGCMDSPIRKAIDNSVYGDDTYYTSRELERKKNECDLYDEDD